MEIWQWILVSGEEYAHTNKLLLYVIDLGLDIHALSKISTTYRS